MKFTKLTVLAVALSLSACSSIKSNLVADQKLETSFVGEQIKIETKCSWMGLGSDCQIVAIEATGTAPSFGSTVNNRKVALTRAEMRAKANVAEFLETQVNTERVNSTISKNIERASDKVKSGKADNEPVTMNDQEAKTISLRENNNDTAVTLTETMHTSAQQILRGFRKVNEKVVGNQEVAVTIRWDTESNNSRKQLQMLMR